MFEEIIRQFTDLKFDEFNKGEILRNGFKGFNLNKCSFSEKDGKTIFILGKYNSDNKIRRADLVLEPNKTFFIRLRTKSTKKFKYQIGHDYLDDLIIELDKINFNQTNLKTFLNLFKSEKIISKFNL